MTAPTTTQTRPAVPQRQPLGQTPVSGPTGSMLRILARIKDPELHERLQDERNGQFARAVAAELDDIRGALAHASTQQALMTDAEAMALQRFLDDHFSVPPESVGGPDRLVGRTMFTLQSLFEQLRQAQRALSERQTDATQKG